MPIEVHKFGGTSVGDAARILAAATLAAEAARRARVCVVSSAMSGVTDTLVGLAARPDDAAALAGLVAKHERALAELRLPASDGAQRRVAALLGEVRELVSMAQRLARLGGTPPALHDRLVSMGERLAVELLAGACRSLGLEAEALAADGFLNTAATYGEAEPVTYSGDPEARAVLMAALEAGRTPVVTGFFGKGPDGGTRLLGRGGSDLSAALLAAALDADELVIWTDVEGVYTADPRLVPDAEPIPGLHYREAGEMAFFGSKVLHPRTTIPVAHKSIATTVRSSMRPTGGITRIDTTERHPAEAATAVSAMKGVALLSLEGGGFAGVAGIVARLFAALAGRDISIVMISQGSSECSVCVGVREADADRAVEAVRAAFADDLARGTVDDVVVKRSMGVLTCVGAGMRRRVGALAAMAGALSRSGTNIYAVAQGSSELSVSFAIDGERMRPAARALHEAMRATPAGDTGARLSVALIGLGGVGRAVAERLTASTPHRLVAVADSSGWLAEGLGLDAARAAAVCSAKAGGTRVASMEGGRPGTARDVLAWMHEQGVANPVLIDCTATPGMVAVAADALAGGVDVVCANKEVLACARPDFARVVTAAAGRGSMLRGEATVGAGLPVARTFEALAASGDRVLRIEASLSGTIGFLLGKLRAGETLGLALSEAIGLGFAEPDPRADVHGLDLMRKAKILRRLAGLGMQDDIAVEPFVSLPGASGVEVERVLEAATRSLQDRLAACRAGGRDLLYLARVGGDGSASVGFVEHESGGVFSGLVGSEACLAVWTELNGARPLVIRGPGAGAMPTAGGILMDLAALSRARAMRATSTFVEA